MNLQKFTFNKKILSTVVTLGYDQICYQTPSIYKYKKFLEEFPCPWLCLCMSIDLLVTT